MRTVAASLALFFATGTQALPESNWQKVDLVSKGVTASASLTSVTTSGNLAFASISGDPLYRAIRSTDGGAIWEQPITVLAPLKLKFLSFLYGVWGDSIMTSMSQGAAWTVLQPALNMNLADVHYINSSPGQAWAVGDSPYVAITTNNWGNSPPPQIVRFPNDSVTMSSIQFLDNNFGFASGRKTGSNATVILRTTDGGQTWEERNLPDICPSAPLLSVDFVSPLTGWAVQTCGTTANFYKTTDAGATWSFQDAKNFFLAFAIDAVDSLYAWTVGQLGSFGAIAKTSNGGVSWAFETVPLASGQLLSVAMRDTSHGFACGRSATLLVYAPGVPTDAPGERDTRPKSFELSQNYPNPFNGETRISFTLLKNQTITLTIYNILGQPVRTLLEGSQPAGKNEISWDGRDASGRLSSSGIYFYKLSTAKEKQVRKMVLLK
ncbi:MAG: T9SS type A sorting domain-containing protein [candidate division Zixibacteria bacterium]|nr:T9SS type A sorting domain-containing protein [candidate division Zixibacteria bacterium]